MAALLGHEASLMEELSSAESGGGGDGRLGLQPTTPASAAAVARRRAESAAVGATAMMNSAASFSAATNAAANANRSSLCGSLRDIQQLMDEQVRLSNPKGFESGKGRSRSRGGELFLSSAHDHFRRPSEAEQKVDSLSRAPL